MDLFNEPVLDTCVVGHLNGLPLLLSFFKKPHFGANTLDELLGYPQSVSSGYNVIDYYLVIGEISTSFTGILPLIGDSFPQTVTSVTGRKINLLNRTDTGVSLIDKYPKHNAGEKESIQLAKLLGTYFITDDIEAQNKALLEGVVIADSITVIQEAVYQQRISIFEAEYMWSKLSWKPRRNIDKIVTRTPSQQRLLNKYGFIAYLSNLNFLLN